MSFNIAQRKRAHHKVDIFPCFCSPFARPFRGKLEKERKEKSRQLGLIRTEGSDGGEDMERERRTFQLQMCEVGDQCQSKHQTQTPFEKAKVGLICVSWVVFIKNSIFHPWPNTWLSFHIPQRKGLLGSLKKLT